MTRIGVWLKDPNEFVVARDGRDEPLPQGYEHFAERREAKTTLDERSEAKTTL